MKNKKCSIEDCTNKYYAKGYCKKHYSFYITHSTRNRRIKGKDRSCLIEDCTEPYRSNGFCHKHLLKGTTIKGELNPRWNGGVSYFKDHYWVKQNRKRLIEERGNICQGCGIKKSYRNNATSY